MIMIKCAYKGPKLGHNLVKNSVTGVTVWVVKDKTRIILSSPFVFLYYLNAKLE